MPKKIKLRIKACLYPLYVLYKPISNDLAYNLLLSILKYK